ncbi:translation initiation factor IF-2, putative [Plasmodium sp. gorilla clade G2]|uniref:translation initiation factor IF-2, putative n=1 Tax=Plasmodium sp. gorilla clade G2 TaxID=880535 RepID=UPI000D22046E|nr:translation initiation factor IF-2, putative [Plasmodium sp. gorilla clade G2]SOV17516.1 translation initiation factor IF-2, putative [Plasmodium sp. gorilla clade G2]
MFNFCSRLLYKGKYIPVGRRVFREKLIKGRKQKSPIILLPPYITVHELRIMLNINYETCFKAANVYKCGNVYRWKDSEDRVFQTVNKRNVIIPYSTAAYVSKIFKYKPKLIQVELNCEEDKYHHEQMNLLDIYKNTYIEEKKYYDEFYFISQNNQKKNSNELKNFNNRGLKNETKNYNINNDISSLLINDKYISSNIYTNNKKINDEKKKNYYTVISVIGHINHGKTTLLDKITNNNLALNEAGCITQNIKPIHFEYPPFKFTFLDTPGHEVFQIFRGRAAFLSDILIILISLEVGAEIQTEEAIKYADKFDIPVIFVLNKADIYGSNESVVKAELKNQCRKMYDEQILKHNFSNEIDKAITISSLTGYNIHKLINRIFFLSQHMNLPYNNINDHNINSNNIDNNVAYESMKKNFLIRQNEDDININHLDDNNNNNNNIHLNKNNPTHDNSNLLKKYIRKSDFLLALDTYPFGMGMVVDISKNSSKGTILNVIIRNGFFIEGNYFICGSAYGRIQKMYKFNTNFKESCTYASVGMAIQITGIRKYGNATTDDLIFTLPQNNAFRLCQYRLMVEKLSTLQVSGKEISVSWENDMKKNEFHAEDIYENRLEMSDKRKAIEEFGVENEPIFNDITYEEFHKSNTQLKKEQDNYIEIELEEENENENENYKSNVEKIKKIQNVLSNDKYDDCIVIPHDNTYSFLKTSKEEEMHVSKNTQISSLNNTNQTNVSDTQTCQPKEQVKGETISICTNKINVKMEKEGDIISDKLINDNKKGYKICPQNNSEPSHKNKNHIIKDQHNREYNNETKEVQVNINNINNEENITYSNLNNEKVESYNVEATIPSRGRKNKYSKNIYEINKKSTFKENVTNGSNNNNEDNYNSKNNENNDLSAPWYYEESEETWAKKVLQRNDELMETWRNKTKQREIEKQRQIFYEKQMILKNEMIKRNLLGEEKLTEEQINAYLYDDPNKKKKYHTDVNENDQNDNETHTEDKFNLPKKNCPVIPIIIRTNYVGIFDIFLDEFENLQKKYNVKISVVHGGIGPITPNDVVHAEVESHFGYCCIYAFQVKVLPDSVKQAVLSNIVIKQFDVFTDLIDDIVKRITNIKALIAHNMYVRSLKKERTQEGM